MRWFPRTVEGWTTEPRCASSSPRGGPRSPRSRPACPTSARRRVPGLRRGEVAALAGVSVEYYAKLERGAIGGVSASVLDAIARALQLDDAERAHLFHLAHAADGTSAGMRPRRRTSQPWTPRPSLSWVLDTITAPAIVRNGRMDLLAANALGRAMHSALYDAAGAPPNFARFTFLDLDAAHDFYPRLGHRRRHLCRDPAHRGGPRPARQGPARPRRGAVHPQRATSAAGGAATTSVCTAPEQAVPPRRGR